MCATSPDAATAQTRVTRRTVLGWLTGAWMAWAPNWARSASRAQEADARRVFAVHARSFQFEPATLDARENDLVVVELDAQDIAHSFVIDAYRIVKRASPGRPVRFEFRADRVGAFAYYCNLTADDRCKGMRGQLTVRPR